MNSRWPSYRSMPLSSVQKGAIGQYSVLAALIATGRGLIEAYMPSADNEGRDVEIRRHLSRLSTIGIQIKCTFFSTKEGRAKGPYLTIRFAIDVGKVQNDPRLWYLIGLYDVHQPGLHHTVFLIRADVFHKMARRGTGKGKVWFAMTASLSPISHDRWTPFRVELKDLGNRILEIIDDATLMASGVLPPLPDGAVWLGRAMPAGIERLPKASVDRKYDLIRNAVLARDSVSGWYQGHLRLFSPFLLGTKAGDPHVLAYQFGGTSEKPLRPEGDPKNWRCLRVAELTKIKLLPGTWHAVPKGKGFQNCIDLVDVRADIRPSARHTVRRAA